MKKWFRGGRSSKQASSSSSPNNEEEDKEATESAASQWAVTPRQAKTYMDRQSSCLSSSKVDNGLLPWNRTIRPYTHQVLQAWDASPAHLKNAQDAWHNYKGSVLEPFLKSNAIALLNAEWLVGYALGNIQLPQQQQQQSTTTSNKSPILLPCRQELPPEAFLSLEQIQSSTRPPRFIRDEEGIHILMLSYVWLSPDHPDPKGTTLQLVAKECQRLLQLAVSKYMYACSQSSRNQEKNKDDDYYYYITEAGCPRFAVFWDYASLFQHPQPKHGVFRNSHQQELFQQALSGLATFYSHPHAFRLQVKDFPPGYPQGYNLPDNANCALYDQRGWPLLESHLFQMVGQPKGGTAANQHSYIYTTPKFPFPNPTQFHQRLSRASFTNLKDDYPLVQNIYNVHFEAHFATVQELTCENWTKEQILHLTEIMQQGTFPQLNSWKLENPRTMDDDVTVEAIRQTLDPTKQQKTIALTQFTLINGSGFGDEGMQQLAGVFLGTLELLVLQKCEIGLAGCQALADAFASTTTAKIKTTKLSLQGNHMRSVVINMLCKCAWVSHQVTQLNLAATNITILGCQSLVERLCTTAGKAPLSVLDLSWNDIGYEGIDWLCQNGLLDSTRSCQLASFRLARTNIGVSSCRRLVETLLSIRKDANRTSGLKHLDLSDNGALGDAGIECFCNVDLLGSQIETFKFANANVQTTGACALVKTILLLEDTKLNSIDFTRNTQTKKAEMKREMTKLESRFPQLKIVCSY